METLDALLFRLGTKGLMPVEITRLIKDCFYIIQKDEEPSTILVNQRLECMGWDVKILDEITYNLIMFFFENRNDYEVIKFPSHYN